MSYHSDRIYRLCCGWLDARSHIRPIIHQEIVNSIKRADCDRRSVTPEQIQLAVLDKTVLR